jgi:hypothetical protein
MARQERLTEEIKYNAELVKVAWATLIAVVAGTAGVAARHLPWELVSGAGAVVAVGLGVMVWRLHKKVEARIAYMEEV